MAAVMAQAIAKSHGRAHRGAKLLVASEAGVPWQVPT